MKQRVWVIKPKRSSIVIHYIENTERAARELLEQKNASRATYGIEPLELFPATLTLDPFMEEK